MWTRMYGGVGGEDERPPIPLARSVDLCAIVDLRAVVDACIAVEERPWAA